MNNANFIINFAVLNSGHCVKRKVIFINLVVALCISLLEGKSHSRSEHLYGKTATNGTFFKVTMMILHKKVSYYLVEILKYLYTTKYLKKYQRLQFYNLYVPILDDTPYIVTKCTVSWLADNCNNPNF